MKNISYYLAKKKLINLRKVDFLKDVNLTSKKSQEEKRLLHFALMKFIKTQYNKKRDTLIKKAKSKDFFNKYNNLNSLPYLKKKNIQNQKEKKMHLSAHPNMTGLAENQNYYTKTNNMNEYTSKRNTIQGQSKSNREKEINNKKKFKNRLKSSFEGETSKYIKFLEISSEKNKLLYNNFLSCKESAKNNNNIIYSFKNSNFNVYHLNIPFIKRKNSIKSHNSELVKDDDINNEKTNFDTPQEENSLNSKNKLNSFKIKSKKILDYINDISNNAEVKFNGTILGKDNNNFSQSYTKKNKNNNLNKNLTYGEEQKISKLINSSPEKNYSYSASKKIEKSFDNNRVTNNIINAKTFYERRKITSTEIRNKTTNIVNNINIKRYKYNLKQVKNDYKNYYKNKYDKYEVNNLKDQSKVNSSSKKKTLLNNKKIEKIDNLRINTKFWQFNPNSLKIGHKYPITFNRNINNRKNNNNDIIDLI